MMRNNFLGLLFFLVQVLFAPTFLSAQDKPEGQFHGNFEINMQSYTKDSIIGAPEVAERMRANTYANFTYTKGKLNFGMRYEAYLNTVLGFDERFNGQGIPYRYGSYKSDEIELTAGNFYEQFGSGIILRAYEDKNLGYDNALDGIRVRYQPTEGLYFKALIGKQRKYFTHSEGIVRALDTELDLNTAFKKLESKLLRFSFGASAVSKFQEADDPVYNYPENVAAFAGRFNLSYKSFLLKTEYAYKANDPSGDNLYDFNPDDGKDIRNPIFKDGQGLLITTNISKRGLGFVLKAMSLDNMGFRSERFASGNDLMINYLPSLSKNHTYALAAMYPYATQQDGQIGANAEFFYKIPRKSLLGGKYGTHLSFNYSQVMNLNRKDIEIDPDLNGYTVGLFDIGNDLYYQDFNLEIYKKLSRKVKATLVYMYQVFDIDRIQGKVGEEEVVSNIGIADVTVKLNRKNALRFEAQSLFSEQYNGNWAMGMIEFSFAPHWFVSVSDQYNYQNPHKEQNIHYYNAYAGYTKSGTRIQIGYGRQREGVICVGGVCRNMPASNGFSLLLTSSF